MFLLIHKKLLQSYEEDIKVKQIIWIKEEKP